MPPKHALPTRPARWFRPRRRFPPTRDGWWFLAATLVIGLVAINAGLNLLFLVWGMMLSLILASGVLSELGLRGLRVRRNPPQSAHAGAPFLMGIALTNGKRRLPSFSVEVEDLVDGRPIEKRCYFLKVPAGRTQETAYRHTVATRGRHRLSGLRISTKFPFGLIQKSRDVQDPIELLVYPALVPVPPSVLGGLPGRTGRAQVRHRSRGGELFGLRELRYGDDPRDIHWRTSARRGTPFVREYEDDDGLDAVISLDNADTGAGQDAFEEAVSMAASIAVELLARGYRVGLGARGVEIAPAGGRDQRTRVLRALALIERRGSDVPLRIPGAPDTVIAVAPGQSPQARSRGGVAWRAG